MRHFSRFSYGLLTILLLFWTAVPTQASSVFNPNPFSILSPSEFTGGYRFSAAPKPDLYIGDVGMAGKADYITVLAIYVKNYCPGPSGPSYVLVTFKESKGGKALLYVGKEFPALEGNGHYRLQIPMPEKKIKFSSKPYVYAEIDPYKKVDESREDNNWASLNPKAGGFGNVRSKCGA